MTDLLAQILRTTDSRDFPRRRATFIAPTMVTIWRVISRDPDEDATVAGALVSETAQLWNLTLPGDTRVTSFPKCTPSGVTVWRRA